jgi:hypothetical protein
VRKPHIVKRNGVWLAFWMRSYALHAGIWPMAKAEQRADLFACLVKYHDPR